MNVNIDNLNKNSLIMQWNVDTNGNPASVRIENEVQQISTTHYLIQLAQIPDEYYQTRIGVDGEADWLQEVYNRDEITYNTYYVDYGLGYVYFDKAHSGKAVIANYYGRGVILLSDSRIFHEQGGVFVDTWDNIMERSKDAIELLETTGSLANVIKVIDEKVEQGNKVADRIEDFIEETEFYGYTILLSREAFVIKAKEDGNADASEYKDIYTDVVVYKGAQQISVPQLQLSLTNQINCEFEIDGQRIRLKTGSMDVDAIKGQATVVIDCGDGLVAKRIVEVTKVFDGVSQYQVDVSNSFYSFQANSDGRIEEEQSVVCDIDVKRANEDYEDYIVTIQNMPLGLTHDIKNGSKVDRVTFTAISGDSLPKNGSVSIIVQARGGEVVSKNFSFNKSKKGVDAKSLSLTGNQLFKYETPMYDGTPSPVRTSINAQITGLNGTPIWSVLKEDGSWELIATQSGTSFQLYHDDNTIWKGRKEVTLRCELNGYADEITIVKIANGASGHDAYSILLSNESTTIPTDASGEAPQNEVEKVYTSVTIYRGVDRVSPTSLSVVNSEDGLYQATVEGNMVKLVSISNEVNSVVIPINITIDGLNFQRIWNISKSKQGEVGASGSTLVLNVEGGTRSIVYNQMNTNPSPTVSAQFIARLYDNGEEVIGDVGYYWTCTGHVSGTSISKTFTPTISSTYDNSVSSNQITVTATYRGNNISHTVPIVALQNMEGLDWVTDWDSTKVSIRGTEVLTPKIFAGTYDEASDSITGVAIGQDVLNDGQTIGVVAYQNNVATFLLGTDGSVEVGDPYQRRTEHGLGIGYNNGQFVGRFSNLTIEGVNVPTTDEVSNSINQAVVNAQNQVREEMEEVNEALINLNDYVNGSLKDGILDEVEKVKTEGLLEIIKQEATDVDGQYISISTNQYLTDAFVIELLENAYNSYKEAYNNVLTKYSELANGTTTNTDEFTESISNFRIASNDLYQVFNNALTSISEVQATLKSEEAKNEVIKEVNDVSDALAGLEQTMNGDFKNGLLGQMNLATLRERLKQLDIEKKDIDGQYEVISIHTELDSATRDKLVQAKGQLDTSHSDLVTKINAVISDGLLTTEELEQINNLISNYSTVLGEYSKVAQEANIAIAVNSAQSAVESISDEDVFNKVTNFGKTQGLFIENGGKVYINAQYIQTRGFTAQKDDGTKTFEIDKDGNVNIVANSFTLTGQGNVATEDYVNSAIEGIVNKNISFSLSNEFQIIPTDATYYPLEEQTFVIQVYGYKGSEQITNFTIGSIVSTNAIKATVSNVNRSITLTISRNISLGSSHGYIDIPITCEGRPYNKRWSWSVAKQGDQAPQINITGEQVFRYSNNFAGEPTPNSIDLTANVYNTTVIGKWQYLQDEIWTDCGVEEKVLTLQPNSFTLPTIKQVTVRYMVEDVFDTFTVVAISDGYNGVDGQDGTDGQDGQDGKGVVSIIEQYYHSTSMTTQTGGSWSTTVPTATRGKYIWTRSIIKYTDTTTTTTTPICVSGSDGTNGNDGVDGVDGTDGVSITSVDVEYAQNTSTTTAPTSGWTTTSPTWASGKYIWSRTKTTYSNGEVTYTNPACITGQKGDTGASGKGIKSITQYYLATSLSTGVTTLTSGWSTSIQSITSAKKYLWNYETILYTDENSTSTVPVIIGVYGDKGQEGNGIKSITEYYLATNLSSGVTTSTLGWTTTIQTPTSSKKYLWNYEVIAYTSGDSQVGTPRIVGNYARDGVDGVDGADGTSSYFYVRYSANSNGSSMTTSPTSTSKYMGVCSTTSTTAPTDYTKYTWTLIKGADGQDGSVGAKGEDGRTSYLHIKYSNDGKTFTSNNGEDVGLYIGTYVDFNQADSNAFSDYTWKKFVGEDGQDGTDAITIVLSNENHTFSANSSGNITATQVTTTSITAYKGASTTTVTIGALPIITGLTLSKSDSTVTIQANTGTSLAETGTFSIPLVIDGKSFTKNFSWTKVRAGETGATGASAKAVDIIASSLVFKSTDGGKVFAPNTIKLTPKLQNLTYYNWQYSTNGGSTWTTVTSGLNGLTISSGELTISKDSPLFTSIVTSLSFRLNTNDTAYYDVVTIVKLYDVADVDFDQIAQDKVDNYDSALNQQKVFDKLTNNGQSQGIYLENDKLYVNGEYVNTRNLKAVKNDGTETFKIDSEGNVSIKANSFYLTGSDTNIADKDYVDTAISNVDVDLTQEGVFNALTNDGQNQGLYIEDGELYVNAEYIQTGTIRADLVKVQVDGKENILPFNYVTFKSGIESWLNIDETNEGIPYAEMDMPIYQGGGSNSYFCRKFGSSTVYLEPNTRYFFSCDIYADVPRDGVETYGVGGSTGTGAELTLMTAMNERYVTEGRYVPILVIDSLALKTVDGQWTHIVYEFTTPTKSEFYSLSNHMYIELNGSNYNTGSYGYIRIANMALEKATEGQATASTFDYLTQLKERRIDLTDDKFYHTRLSVDGFSTEEGIIEGKTSTDGHDYLLNYDGLAVSKSTRERYFVGKDKSYYSYEAGSSGIISGHNNIYGVGGVHRNLSDEYAGYRGIFAGVHYGFQIPNSTAFGRPDIYVHNGEWGLDFEEWQLLGDIIEPRGLVRRDDSKNITTNNQLKFLVGGGTDTANVWNQEQYNTTGNGQMLTYSDGRVFVSNPQTPLVLESSVTPSVKIGNDVEHQLFHTGYIPKSGNWWNGGAVRVSGDGVCEVGKYIDFHNSNSSTSDYDMRLSVENDGGMRCTGSIRAGGGFDCNGGYWINGYQCVARATHGGFDFGHTGANTALLSANAPTWWNGSVSQTIYTTGNKPSVIDPKGVMSNAEYGRNAYDSGIYTYNLHNNSLINGDSSWSAYAGYWSVLSWGRGAGGSAQLAVDWTAGGKGIYIRSLRDTQDNWWTWKRIPNDQWVQTSTSDIRYKEVMSDVDLDDCYSMVKNIGLHSYLLLDEEDRHTEGFDAELAFLKATQEEGISRKLQMGVIAQEMLDYKCADFVVVQDVLKGKDGEVLSDRYSIDAYNYASAILGGLQKEIQVRDEQYEELKQENEELKAKVDSLEQRLAKLEALLGQE